MNLRFNWRIGRNTPAARWNIAYYITHAHLAAGVLLAAQDDGLSKHSEYEDSTNLIEKVSDHQALDALRRGLRDSGEDVISRACDDARLFQIEAAEERAAHLWPDSKERGT